MYPCLRVLHAKSKNELVSCNFEQNQFAWSLQQLVNVYFPENLALADKEFYTFVGDNIIARCAL